MGADSRDLTDVREGVTLQINLAPGDFSYALHTVPHQLRQWEQQVQEVVFSLESHQSEGRYGREWENRDSLREFLDALCAGRPKARISVVDYSAAARGAVSAAFFGGRAAPLKSHRGAPFYAYFHGLLSARFNHVLHMDSDMLFGGGSQSWLDEARALLAGRPEVLFCSPFAGPPAPDGEIPDRVHARMVRWGGVIHGREPGAVLAYRFGDVSTRVFLVDRSRLRSELAPLRPSHPGLGGRLGRKGASQTNVRRLLRARLRRLPHHGSAEGTLSQAMREAKLVRVDYLGRDPGMWSLHPVAHTEDLLRELPHILERVESGNIPEGQLGDYDINDSMLEGQSIHADAKNPSLWDQAAQVAARLRAR
jgi:hypothetical protein